MRVNMDSSILGDPRFRMVAASLDVSLREVIGTCFMLWLACYERRSKCLRRAEAEVAAELPGFIDTLIQEELATDLGGGVVEIHGVEKRIKFLNEQAEKGAKGGRSKKSSWGADKKQMLPDKESIGLNFPQAYSPDLDQSLDQDQDKQVAGPDYPLDAYRVADYLRVKILDQQPEHRLGLSTYWTKSLRDSWAKIIDLMMRRDRRSAKGAMALIDWVFGDQGGSEKRFVVESPRTMREKWDAISRAAKDARERKSKSEPHAPERVILNPRGDS